MNRFLSLFAVVALLLYLPKGALAEEEEGASSPSSTTESHASSPSVRFDLLGGSLLGRASQGYVDAVSYAPALVLGLGAQISDHAALYARVEGGTILLVSEGAAYLVGEWTPVRTVSLGTGIGYDGMSALWVGGCIPSDAPNGHCIQNSWSGVSVPFIVGLNFRGRRGEDGGGGKLRVEIEAAGGYDVRTETWGAHAFIGIGGSWR